MVMLVIVMGVTTWMAMMMMETAMKTEAVLVVVSVATG